MQTARRNQRSPEALGYRKLYKSAAWRRLRTCQLAAHPFCSRCEAEGRRTWATVVDHEVPHRGERALFADPANLRSMCPEHHDRDKQREEALGYSPAIGADGWPLDPRHRAYGGKPGGSGPASPSDLPQI